jgi:hypothetical protein
MTTHHVCAMLPADASAEMLAEIAYEALDRLSAKGCNLESMRHYADPLKAPHLFFDSYNPQKIHAWFADV